MKVSDDVVRLQELDRGDSLVYKNGSRDSLISAYEYRKIKWWGFKPLLHQRASTLACLDYESYLLLLDKGLGKSKIILDTFSHRVSHGQCKSGLLLCPNQTTVQGWLDEIVTHAPHAQHWGCPSDPSDKRKWFYRILDGHATPDLAVIDYSSLQTMLCERKGDKWELREEWAREFGKRFDFTALDEIHGLKDYKSLRFQMMVQMLEPIKYRYGATATLFNQDPTEAWAQAYLLDGGWNYGTTITAFRTIFCKDKYDPFARGHRVSVFDESKMDLFRTWLRGMSIRYLLPECKDLPGLRPVHPELKMTDEQRTIYRGVLKEVKEAKKADPDARVNAFQRLRRVMSGFIPLGKEYVPMAFSPKLSWTLQRIQQWKEPVVIFYEFTDTGRQIRDLLESQGIVTGWMWAGTKDKQNLMRAWKDARLDVLVIQNQVGGVGLNLQRARRQIIFECPTSAILRSQVNGRCWRLGQDKVTYIYDLFFPGTVEQRVFDRVQDGMSLHSAVVEGVKEEEAA